MTVSATEFKAKCLAILDRVQRTGEAVVITKRGKIVARVVPAHPSDAKPWLTLRGTKVEWHGDPFAPAVDEEDIEALK